MTSVSHERLDLIESVLRTGPLTKTIPKARGIGATNQTIRSVAILRMGYTSAGVWAAMNTLRKRRKAKITPR
jgi:hypothetical protein